MTWKKVPQNLQLHHFFNKLFIILILHVSLGMILTVQKAHSRKAMKKTQMEQIRKFLNLLTLSCDCQTNWQNKTVIWQVGRHFEFKPAFRNSTYRPTILPRQYGLPCQKPLRPPLFEKWVRTSCLPSSSGGTLAWPCCIRSLS